jgi:hypothetical protein
MNALRHGMRSAEAIEERKRLGELLREMEEMRRYAEA